MILLSNRGTEIRCSGCKKMLGRYIGYGNVKCSRCGGTNIFNTATGENAFYEKGTHPLAKRKTSSGINFSHSG